MAELSSIEAIYGKYSRFYDAIFGSFFAQGQRIAVKLMDISQGDEVLEVGIGTGALLPFYPRDVRLVGIDISEPMLSRARTLMGKLKMPNVHMMRMDATALEFEDDRFDKIMAAYVITVVPEPVKAVQEMKRVCKTGGEIFFISHFRSNRWPIRQIEGLISPLCEKIGFYTNLDLDSLLRESDLEAALVRRVNLFGMWKIVKCINP